MDTDYGSLVIHSYRKRVSQRPLADGDPYVHAEFKNDTYGKGRLGVMASFAVGRNGVTSERGGFVVCGVCDTE